MSARSLAMALAEDSEANLALISTPGEYAAAEALKAIARREVKGKAILVMS